MALSRHYVRTVKQAHKNESIGFSLFSPQLNRQPSSCGSQWYAPLLQDACAHTRYLLCFKTWACHTDFSTAHSSSHTSRTHHPRCTHFITTNCIQTDCPPSILPPVQCLETGRVEKLIPRFYTSKVEWGMGLSESHRTGVATAPPEMDTGFLSSTNLCLKRPLTVQYLSTRYRSAV